MAFRERVMAAYKAYRDYGRQSVLDRDAQDERYALLGIFYAGTWSFDARWKDLPTDVYRNARQIVKHTGAIVDCYQQLVYSGDLPTPGKELPEGVQSAIPIEPQTSSKQDDEALLRAFYTGFDITKWRQSMSLIPKTAAIFGDVLVVLVDEFDDRVNHRGLVTPELINPWDVPPNGLELDHAGNVKALAIERDVHIEDSTAFGRNVKAERFRYRQEITPEEFRYYKDDKPFAYPGLGDAVQTNPYGFVPAAWFRHELVVGSDRGMGAYEKTLLPALEISSLLSSAIDYQRKKFGFPIGVKGSSLRPGTTLTLPGGITFSASTTAADVEASRRMAAESQHFLPLDERGEFVTVDFDIGQTRELLEFLDNNLIEENPEAKYAQLLAELKMATGPGVGMTLRPIKAKVQAAANNHDIQMVKVWQMYTSMMGFRLNNGDIPAEIVAARPDRYKPFEPYTLDSFGQGKLDATIPVRDPFPESKFEKAQWVTLVDSMSPWGMRQMGVSEDEVAQITSERQRAADAFDEQLTGIGGENGGDAA